MKKRQFIILILLLVIGFASVSTTLILNGKVGLGVELDDYDVIFIEALLNGEENEKAIISADKKTITFTTDKLSNVEDKARLDYKVKNNSTQYDADVTINCTNDKSEYVTVTSEFDGNSIPLVTPVNMKAQEVKNGYVNAELSKAYAGEDDSIEITCKIVFTATSRDTYAYSINFDSNGGSKIDDKIVILNDAYGELETPEKEGYIFLGWFDENDVKVEEETILKNKGNKTLYAKWTPVCPYEVGKEWTFDYTGREQEFIVPCDGNYKLETWGAQGGSVNSNYIGGYGSYSSGDALFSESNSLYINVGGQGESCSAYNGASSIGNGGYNGGGAVTCVSWNAAYIHISGGGGGATHVSSKSGILSTLSNDIDEVLIVSGGGGGAAYWNDSNRNVESSGGSAGGFIGSKATIYVNYWNLTLGAGGTQNEGYSFGIGEGTHSAGSGSGFYGGRNGSGPGSGGSGGSGYIGNPHLTNKAMYCYNCTVSNEESTKTISTTCASSTPTSNCAKQGNGYAKITLVSLS